MRMGQRIIQARAFFNLPLIRIFAAEQEVGSLAAFRAHAINFKSNSGSSANGQPRVMFGRSHPVIIDYSPANAIQTDCDSKIGVCLTRTP
jgi:hypothetical protein